MMLVPTLAVGTRATSERLCPVTAQPIAAPTEKRFRTNGESKCGESVGRASVRPTRLSAELCVSRPFARASASQPRSHPRGSARLMRSFVLRSKWQLVLSRLRWSRGAGRPCRSWWKGTDGLEIFEEFDGFCRSCRPRGRKPLMLQWERDIVGCTHHTFPSRDDDWSRRRLEHLAVAIWLCWQPCSAQQPGCSSGFTACGLLWRCHAFGAAWRCAWG